MKRSIPFWSSVIIALVSLASFALIGCHTNTVTDGGPDRSAQSPTPAQVSSSAEVVKVTTVPVSISQTGPADAVVTLSISPGFHVNANPATFPYLIATEVDHTIDPDEKLPVMGKPIYPMPISRKFSFAEKPLAVYEGNVNVKLPLHLPDPTRTSGTIAKGPKSFSITVRVQACDEQQCFPPSTLNANIQIEVK